jgi:hypothetical protein
VAKGVDGDGPSSDPIEEARPDRPGGFCFLGDSRGPQSARLAGPYSVIASGASASMSVVTSMITGRSLTARALSMAPPMSPGFSTLNPTAPISSASRAKLVSR